MLLRLLHLTHECPSASVLLLLSLSFAEANSVSSLHCTCMHWDLHLLKLKNTTFGKWTCQSKLAKYPTAVHVEYVVVKVVLGGDFFKHAGLPCESPIHLCAIQIHCILDIAVPHSHASAATTTTAVAAAAAAATTTITTSSPPSQTSPQLVHTAISPAKLQALNTWVLLPENGWNL